MSDAIILIEVIAAVAAAAIAVGGPLGLFARIFEGLRGMRKHRRAAR
jgi:hypothetical protein